MAITYSSRVLHERSRCSAGARARYLAASGRGSTRERGSFRTATTGSEVLSRHGVHL